MRIDEFIELYTPLEVEKLDERKKFENSPARKNSLGKLGSMCKVYVVSEKSKQEISAQKAAKIIQESFVSGKTKFATCLALPRKPSSGPSAGEGTPSKRLAKKNSISDKHN
jgi:hypothetical protein